MAREKGDDDFKSCLTEASKQKAKEELNERNDEDRKLAVQTFRQWVLQQKTWLKTPTDFEFLLRFLRVRKFSQLEARKTLENYWTCRASRPDYSKDIDPEDPVLQEILRNGMYYSPRKYDKDGCRWFYSVFGNQTTELVDKWGIPNLCRVMVLFVEWVCWDENVQVNGVKWLLDCSRLSLGVVMKYSKPDDQKFMNNLFQKSSPARMKAFYFYNEPTFFDVMYSMFSVFSTKKILERIHLVGHNMVKIYEKVDLSMLPNEYLPDDYHGPCAGSQSQIIEEMIADMTSPKFKKYIREVTSSKYGMDLSKKPSQDEQEPAASFRKLNVD